MIWLFGNYWYDYLIYLLISVFVVISCNIYVIYICLIVLLYVYKNCDCINDVL